MLYLVILHINYNLCWLNPMKIAIVVGCGPLEQAIKCWLRVAQPFEIVQDPLGTPNLWVMWHQGSEVWTFSELICFRLQAVRNSHIVWVPLTGGSKFPAANDLSAPNIPSHKPSANCIQLLVWAGGLQFSRPRYDRYVKSKLHSRNPKRGRIPYPIPCSQYVPVCDFIPYIWFLAGCWIWMGEWMGIDY